MPSRASWSTHNNNTYIVRVRCLSIFFCILFAYLLVSQLTSGVRRSDPRLDSRAVAWFCSAPAPSCPQRGGGMDDQRRGRSRRHSCDAGALRHARSRTFVAAIVWRRVLAQNVRRTVYDNACGYACAHPACARALCAVCARTLGEATIYLRLRISRTPCGACEDPRNATHYATDLGATGSMGVQIQACSRACQLTHTARSSVRATTRFA